MGFVEAPAAGLDLPLDIRGTAFQERVWRALREIPAGRTLSYAEVAARIGSPKAVRAVGNRLRREPTRGRDPLPSRGAMSREASGYRWGVERKRALLEREGSGRLRLDNPSEAPYAPNVRSDRVPCPCATSTSPAAPSPSAEHGMAATSHPLATLTAVEVLKAGGQCDGCRACGGRGAGRGRAGHDGHRRRLLLPLCQGWRVAGGADGSGRAPAAGLGRVVRRARNLARADLPHAVTVPGAVDAWVRPQRRAWLETLEELLRPAIRLAADGYRVTPRVAADARHSSARVGVDPDARAAFLPGGAPPAIGDLVRMPALAETLVAIGKHGREAFYAGAVAEGIVAKLGALAACMRSRTSKRSARRPRRRSRRASAITTSTNARRTARA